MIKADTKDLFDEVHHANCHEGSKHLGGRMPGSVLGDE